MGRPWQKTAPRLRCGAKGFTLFELIVVMAVLSVVLLIAYPKLPHLEEIELNAEARRMAGLIRYLDEAAFTKKVYFRAWFRPDNGSVEVESSQDGLEFKNALDPSLRGFALRSGTDIRDIVVQGLGTINRGEAGVVFNPGIGAEAFNLHLERNGRVLTVSYNPYTGRVKIIDCYV